MREAPTTGSDCRVTLLWIGARIELERVSSFSARQVVDTQSQHPMNNDPLVIYNPAGWQGRIVTDRFGSDVDQLFDSIEQAFRNSGGEPWVQQTSNQSIDPVTGQTTFSQSGLPPGTIFANVYERDGSTTTFQFSGVSAYLADAGEFRMGRVVQQTIGFFASARTII